MIYQSSNVRFIYQMVRAGNGFGILPARFFSPLDPVSPFSMEPKLISHTVIAYQKDRQISEAETYLLGLFKSHFGQNRDGG